MEKVTILTGEEVSFGMEILLVSEEGLLELKLLVTEVTPVRPVRLLIDPLQFD